MRRISMTSVALSALLALALGTIAAAGPQGGTILTVAGRGPVQELGDGGPATEAALWLVRGMEIDSQGTLYLTDVDNARVRRVDPVTGIITTLAGTGEDGYSGDGRPANEAQLHAPQGVALDEAGSTLYIADTSNNRVRAVDLATGTIRTVVGTGLGISSGDGGPAALASTWWPVALEVHESRLYVVEFLGNRVRRVDPDGTITTLVGTGQPGFRGDGGPATQAALNYPFDLAIDAAGAMYIADANNGRIRRVDPGGIITTVAGIGSIPGNRMPWAASEVTPPGAALGDGGPATRAILSRPRGVAIDAAGNLYIADTDSHRIRRVDPSGTIATVAGSMYRGFAGDGGPATRARLWAPEGVAVDSAGNLYIADTINGRVRRVTAPLEAASPLDVLPP